MMNWFRHIFLTCAWFSLPIASHAAVSVGIDVVQPGDLTIVLRDFNGTSDPAALSQNNSGMPNPTFESIQNGYATYEVDPFSEANPYTTSPQHDPRLTFTTDPYNIADYNYVRTRQSYSVPIGTTLSKAPASEMWPNSAVGSTQVTLGNMTQTFSTYNKPWSDPTNSSITTSTTGGFRWDPVVTGITTNTPIQFQLDYFMADRGRVEGTEFDSVGTDRMGWTPIQINTDTLATLLDSDNNSVLRGVTTGSDAYLLRSGLTLGTSIYKYVEVRLKMEQNTQLQFFWSTNQPGNTGLNEAKSVKFFTGDNQWHTYLLDFTNEATWTGNLTQFRVDLGGTSGVGFDIDYIRFREIGAVPEPSRMVLGALAITSLFFHRRRVSRVA